MSAISTAERAVLERERIARQKRRHTAIEDNATKKIKTSHEKAPSNDVIEISDDESPSQDDTTQEERFWHGESRSVRNQLADNSDPTFSLDEIVGKVCTKLLLRGFWVLTLCYLTGGFGSGHRCIVLLGNGLVHSALPGPPSSPDCHLDSADKREQR